ncbi:hypothetical protein PVAND_017210 [Polypedilum vanderplanki]|uniref:Leucine rich repeat protein n=1 Tax=Polypedilum vanderplanki TaxID=319348 RepID=A0A9J6BHZ1_POLVA|nr:hypothetical protein PVAND_017210 [Polypedilum vanderplanki]
MNKFLILSIYFLTTIILTSSVELECQFNVNLDSEYECEVQDNEIFGNSLVTITDIDGEHLAGKTNRNVQKLIISNIPKVKFVPKEIGKFFKKLTTLEITNANLIKIKQIDLQQFLKLKKLILNDNEIEIIEEELFESTPKLEYIDLSNNKISLIDPSAFSNLKNLQNLYLVNNTCEFFIKNAENQNDLRDLIEEIENRKCYAPSSYVATFIVLTVILFVIIALIATIFAEKFILIKK